MAELKMLRFSLGVTRMDKIRNEYIRWTAQVGRFGEKTREARLRWYGHVLRKDNGYIGRRMLRMELPGMRKPTYLLPVSRNHQGRRGTTADIGDNLLPSLTVFGCSLTAVEVETGPLSDV